MDCNKDEALRAMEIAGKKFSANDFVGAKRFVSKANSLYPGLAGLSHMLATIDVYVAAENKVNGEADWYGVLGVDSRVDDEAMKKQYRKMALALHPDKNKSAGADGAFKLLSEAWKLLSDKGNRAAYDQRRKAKALPTAPVPAGGSAAPAGAYGSNKGGSAAPSGAYGSNKGGSAAPSGAYGSNKGGSAAPSGAYGSNKGGSAAPSGAYGSNKGGSAAPSGAYGSNKGGSAAPNRSTAGGSAASGAHASNKSAKGGSSRNTSTAGSGKHSTPASRSSTPVNPKPETFWTVCYRCKLCYEYPRVYLNHNLKCVCCSLPFAAKEIAPPSFDLNPLKSMKISQQQQKASFETKYNSPSNGTAAVRRPGHFTCYLWDPVSKAFSEEVAPQPNERVKRGREEEEAATKREKAVRMKV